jgi:glycerol-3-phosphate dehydrogenase
MNRKFNIEQLKQQEFDICIIGGGISGVGCALDAQLRGLKVALIEKDDFAAKTSSRSTKLIHGGVRYLEQAFKNFDFAQLRQVKHGLEERAILIKNAPHLAHPLALLTPCYTWLEGLYYYFGLKIYSWFAKNDNLPKSEWITKAETLQRLKGLNPKIHSGILYYDGQLDDARYCLAVAKTADSKGAIIANHIKVIDFQKDNDGKINNVLVKDTLCNDFFEIKTKCVINCTGPSADSIRLLANPNVEKRIQQSKGVHIVLPLHVLENPETALLIPKTTDGRVVFAIPWEQKLLLGTTDTPYSEQTDEPSANSNEIDFLIDNLNRYLKQYIDKKQVMSAFAGIRPLIKGNQRATKQLLRDHEVEFDEKSGLISLMGGKWTTYRLMAKDTIDFVCKNLNHQVKCNTENQFLSGAENYDSENWKNIAQIFDFEEDVAKHLSEKYGTEAYVFLAKANLNENTYLKDRVVEGYPFIAAEILYQIEEEMACTLDDVLSRRLRLAFLDWNACQKAIPKVADLMGTALGWTMEEKNEKITSFNAEIEQFKLQINLK